MRLKDIAIAVVVATIWGLNFVFMQIVLGTVPPLFLGVLRFFLAAVPAIFFVPRPRIPFATLALYGLSAFALQFGFLLTAMRAVPAGLTSLILQTQVFFTMSLAVRAFGDRPRMTGWFGAVLAFAGVGLVAVHGRGDVSPVGIVLILLAAMSWAVGNVTAKRAGAVNPFALVVWGSAVAVPPLLALSLALEGPRSILAGLSGLSLGQVGALGYIAGGATLFAHSLWARLLHRHPASTVAPFTLLLPVAGLLGSVLILEEAVPPWKLVTAALVITGLGIHLLGARVASARTRLGARVRAAAAPLRETSPGLNLNLSSDSL